MISKRLILIVLGAGLLCGGCPGSPLDQHRPMANSGDASLPSVEADVLAPVSDAILVEVTTDGMRLSMERICQSAQRDAREQLGTTWRWYERVFGDDDVAEIEKALETVCGSGPGDTWVEVMSLADGRIDDTALAIDDTAMAKDAPKLVIEPLLAELTTMVDRAKRLTMATNARWRPELIIAADRDLPYRTLAAVQYTAGQAELSIFEFLTDSNDPLANVVSPHSPMPQCCGDDFRAKRIECADVHLTLAADAAHINLKKSTGAPGYPSPSPPRTEVEPRDAAQAGNEPIPDKAWHDSLVTAGDCPTSTRRKDGSLDTSEVMKVIEGFDEAPYCGRATVSVTAESWSKVTYGDWLRVLAELQSADAIHYLSWTVERAAEPRCEDAYELPLRPTD